MNLKNKQEYLLDLGYTQDKKMTQVFHKDLDSKYSSISFPSNNEEVREMNEFACFYCLTYESNNDSSDFMFDTFEELLGFLFSNLDPFFMNVAYLDKIYYNQDYYKTCKDCRTRVHEGCINKVTHETFSHFKSKWKNALLCDSCIDDNEILYRTDITI
tara:strand:+ start:177 stop:650 length:474 start_codon:yes stop_codon:yes gene_type:complete